MERFGPLRLGCVQCNGFGYVSRDPDPGDGGQTDDGDHRLESVSEAAAVVKFPGCRTCLGAGVIVNIREVGHLSEVVESPCPACGGRSAR